jgi:hypothetical protein
MNTLQDAYYSDTLGYMGQRTQFDLDLQNKWCPTCGDAPCTTNHQDVQLVSTSGPWAFAPMRTNYDLAMKDKLSPNMAPCQTFAQNLTVPLVSTSGPWAFAPMRSNYDLAMKSKFNAGDSLSCMSGYPAPTQMPAPVKENFSYGLSFNDPDNVWSYTGDINCAATCAPACDPYPMAVSNCGGSFDIVQGAGCADICNGYGCGTRPVSTYSNYIYNPYQDTTCCSRSGCGSGRTCSSCSK